MKKSKIIGLFTALAGLILIIKTIPLLAWYIMLGVLVVGLLFCSAFKR